MKRVAGSLVTVVCLALLGGCSFPTDQSTRLSIQVPLPAVYVGDTVPLRARIVQTSGSSANIPPDVHFNVSPLSRAIVTSNNELIALDSGTVTLTTTSREYEVSDVQTVPIQNVIWIDSVVPSTDTLLVGETLQIHGVGLENSLVKLQHFVETVSYVRDVPTSANGSGVLTVVVPPVPKSGVRLQVTGSHGTASYPVRFTVLPFDVLEPNDTAPTKLNFVIDTGFVHKGLVLEADTVAPRDWYVFHTNATGDVTISVAPVEGTALASRLDLVVADSMTFTGGLLRPAGAWLMDFGAPHCGLPTALPAESLATVLQFEKHVVIHALPAGDHHVVVYDEQPRGTVAPYQIAIVPGYESALPADADEGNDVCSQATSLALPATNIARTIEEGGARDWYKFTVADSSSISVTAAANGAATLTAAIFVAGGNEPLAIGTSTIGAVVGPGTYDVVFTSETATAYTFSVAATPVP